MAQNAANEEKRYTLRLQAWTEVYTALKISTETTAPVLSRVLRDECPPRTVPTRQKPLRMRAW